jgi:F420 biosynthesis protein FbiB-like protein
MVEIEARRMIRHYTNQPVARWLIEKLLSAAATAPSPHNRQPWRFAILRGKKRDDLAVAMGAQLERDLMRDGVTLEVIAKEVERSRLRITSAPVSILVCLSMVDMDVYLDAQRTAYEKLMAVQAVACAVQNILLKARELELGACWMCAPLFCPDVARDTLQLSRDWEPQALITIGHPADSGKLRERKSIDEISIWLD